MESSNEKKQELPEEFKNHCMVGKYEYETVDKHSGLTTPTFAGNFVVTRPHSTFRVPVWFNHDEDPFPRLEEVTMEKGDALLFSPAKTGTHVMFEIMKMLQDSSAESTKISYFDKWIDVSPYDTIMANQPAPRVLVTHLLLSWLAPQLRRADTKVVVTVRNMKDSFVSFYKHLEGMNRGPVKKSWDEYFNYLMNFRSALFSNYFEAFAEIWDNCRHDPNVLIVFYETLVRNKRETVEAIAKHMGVAYTDKLLDDISAATEFKTMKKAKHDDEKFVRDRYGDKFSMYRKGEVGDWKNHFTVAQNEEFHRVFDEWNKERQIPMVFE